VVESFAITEECPCMFWMAHICKMHARVEKCTIIQSKHQLHLQRVKRTHVSCTNTFVEAVSMFSYNPTNLLFDYCLNLYLSLTVNFLCVLKGQSTLSLVHTLSASAK